MTFNEYFVTILFYCKRSDLQYFRFDATILQNKINIICLFLKKITVFLPSI
jgi:hypothetical protein